LVYPFLLQAQTNITAVNGTPFPSLLDVTIDDLVEGLSTGLFTSVDLVSAYLARIEQVNPILHAVNEVNPDALSIAAELDTLRANGTTLGPLHGIPILMKDNIATADKMNNTAGSYALLGAKVPNDSTLAKKLREAGAVILGKTNLSQWANYRSGNTSNGWTAIGGQTLARIIPTRIPAVVPAEAVSQRPLASLLLLWEARRRAPSSRRHRRATWSVSSRQSA
jgi:amidase